MKAALMTNFEIACLIPDLPSPAEYHSLLDEMHANRWYTNFGPLARQFEKEMAAFCSDGKDASLSAATFSSATTALELIFRALALPGRGRVLIPALTFPATALAVMNAGYEPVLSDVDESTWALTPEIAREAHAVSPLSAVVPVAAFGAPIAPELWEQFQEETGVPVILDAAAALGQQAASEQLVTVFSLHATKPFGVGEGGLVVASDEQLLSRAQSFSNFGFSGPAGVVQRIGTNAKLGEYYAAVGIAQLKRWPTIFARRQAVAQLYDANLKSLNGVVRQRTSTDFVPAVLPVFVENKGAELFDVFARAHIQTRRWYVPLLYKHPALEGIKCASGDYDDLVVANRLAKGLIGLPFHAFLEESDVVKVCRILGDLSCE